MAHAGTTLRTLRTSLGLSIRKTAAMAGVNATMLSQVERGLREPSPRWVKAVTDALAEHLGGAA